MPRKKIDDHGTGIPPHLTRYNHSIGPLRHNDQVNAERTALTGNGGEVANDCGGFLLEGVIPLMPDENSFDTFGYSDYQMLNYWAIFLRGMRSTLLVIKQIPTKQNAILIEKKALAVLGDTVCGIGVVQDDLRQNIIRRIAPGKRGRKGVIPLMPDENSFDTFGYSDYQTLNYWE